MKTISDLDGFSDLCNETILQITCAGCSDERESPMISGPYTSPTPSIEK